MVTKKRVELSQDWFKWYNNMTKESVYVRKELNSHRVGLVQQHDKESVYIRKELNSHRIGLVQQHGKRKF